MFGKRPLHAVRLWQRQAAVRIELDLDLDDHRPKPQQPASLGDNSMHEVVGGVKAINATGGKRLALALRYRPETGDIVPWLFRSLPARSLLQERHERR